MGNSNRRWFYLLIAWSMLISCRSEEPGTTAVLSSIFATRTAVSESVTPLPHTNLIPSSACEYWVAPLPTGDDSNPGTFTEPWATLDHAAAYVPDNHCTVWFHEGIYKGSNDLTERFSTPTIFKAITPYQAVFEHQGNVIELDGVRNMIFEGFEMRHSGPDSGRFVVVADRRNETWSEYVTFRNNIIHDSYNNDLLKIHNGARFFTIEGNIFYNQTASEQHMDVNGVTDVVIQDNIFFNDFAGSGRPNNQDTKHFIVVKGSNVTGDDLEGSERITIRRNIFLNWEGSVETFVKIGNDGKPYYEAQDVQVENNLMIGNGADELVSSFGVSGAKNVTFTNNTVIGDLPSRAYAFRVDIKRDNPLNENILFYNNIWADFTGTMGWRSQDDTRRFSTGNANETNRLILDHNLYWNGDQEIPSGSLVSPLVDDAHALVADPGLELDQTTLVLPRWQGTTFVSGNSSIRQEFLRLVEQYGHIPMDSPAIDMAEPTFAPYDDILGCPRTVLPDIGATEAYQHVYLSPSTSEPQLDNGLFLCGAKALYTKAPK